MYSKLGIRLASRVSEQINTVWNVSKYGVFSGPHFPHSDWIRRDFVFSPNAGKFGPEKTPYLDTFHVVYDLST